jgi:hypothetical protein
MAELPEASGLAASSRLADLLWSHNDFRGDPALFALNTRGAVTARLSLVGATATDWEAIAIGPGPCPARSLYIADIGDNAAVRERITVYRVAEPAPGEATVPVQAVFHGTYPDTAHDAETLLVTRDGELFIVTKGSTGPVGLYKFPRELRSGENHSLQRVGQIRGTERPDREDRITDGAVSASGDWVLLRTREYFSIYRTADLLSGDWREVRRVDLQMLGEPQGEAISVDRNGTIYIAGEGGGRSIPGTFAWLTCTLDSLIESQW